MSGAEAPEPGTRDERLVVCAGMPRSGSTWLFNAVRLLLRRRHGGELVSGWVHDLPDPAGIVADKLLIKVHRFDPGLAARAHKVFYSYRDLRDVMASRLRGHGKPFDCEVAARFIRWDREWKGTADHVMRYERMIAAPEQMLLELAEALGLSLSTGDSMALAAALAAQRSDDLAERRLDYDKHHPDNLLHCGHVTDGRHGSWRGTLAPEEIARIEAEFAGWFVANGYPL